MSVTFDPDYTGQRVKVAWPGADTVYGQDPAYIEFTETGQVMRARRASDAEVQWWMTLQAMTTLQYEITHLTDRVVELLQRRF